MIDACADAQTIKIAHLAEAESTLDEPFKLTFPIKIKRFDYWKRMEFSYKEWESLYNHAKEKIYFLWYQFFLKEHLI